MSQATPLVSRHSGTPLYRQIAIHLEAELTSEYAPGEKLPFESELAQRYSVNRLTVRQAIAELVRRGLVETVHGKGSFRTVPTARYDVAAGLDASFTRTMRGNGHVVETRLLKIRTVQAEEIQRQLATTALLRRTDILRLVDDQPWSLTSTWMVPDQFPGLDLKWDGTSSLYTVLEQEYGVRMKRANRSFAALPADSADAEWLMLPMAAPILQVRGLNVDQHGHPVAVVEHHYRGDRLQFTMELE